MFKNTNTNLNKLRSIQSQIKQCKSAMELCKCPQTDWRMANRIENYFSRLMDGTVDIASFTDYRNIDLDYLEEFGTYLVNFSKYQKDIQKYQEEINKLKKQERELKNALGIE